MDYRSIDFILNQEQLISEENTYKKLIPKGKKIALFGAGQNYWAFKFFVVDKFEINISLIIDDKYENIDFFDSIKVTSSFSNYIKELYKDDYIVIITLGNTSQHKNIKEKLIKIGFKNILNAYDFYEYHLAYASSSVVYGGINYYQRRKKEINNAFNLLQDDLSKEIYCQILDVYVTRRIKPINSRSFDEQYIPCDISLTKGHTSMINCGSFDGDTIKRLIKQGIKFQTIVCIEPNIKNFMALSNWIKKEKAKNPNFAKNVILLPVCIGNKTEYLNIYDAGSNSNINKKTGTTIKALCVALDQIVELEEITFINMDIEGAEIQALDGCKNLIKKYEPDLAISVYHEPSQLWEVLLKIKKYSDNYQFFLRNYTGRVAETVLYATMKKI